MRPATIELLPAAATASPAVRRRHGEAGGATLEDLILEAWEGLAARGRAECPVCRGALEADGCRGCGSALS